MSDESGPPEVPEDVNDEIIQNLAEGVPLPDHPDFHPDLPDADSPEWQAEIALEDGS